MFRIDHRVFADVDFVNGEDAERIAERFIDFAIRKDPDCHEMHLDVIKFMEPDESGADAPGWFHWKTMECRIGSNLRESY